MFDFLDFNNNGHIDPGEAFIGASIAGSIGYGAALSEAEERESYLRDEYEEKLERKRRRIEELEDELEEAREALYDDDWDDDDDWEDNDDWDDDEDDDDDDYDDEDDDWF